MLDIFNNLKPFFEDCYRRINVREYARLVNVSPPTASTMLLTLYKEGLLSQEKDRNYIFYYANKKSTLFIDLSRIYWSIRLKGVVDFIESELAAPTIILFGSLSKGEVKSDSDVDICVLGHSKESTLEKFERALGRKIQLFFFSSIKDIKHGELANNILGGHILLGRIRL